MNHFSELVLFHRFFPLRCMFSEKNPAIKRQSALDVFYFYIAEWTSEIRREHEASLMHITAATVIRSF